MIRSAFKSLFKMPRPRIPEGSAVFAIGDIHGRADLLERVFDKIEKKKQRLALDRYYEIYLGDYVDRGPKSYEVLNVLFDRSSDPNVVLLCGNHESMMAKSLKNLEQFSTWRYLGGLETVFSYGVSISTIENLEELETIRSEWVSSVPKSHKELLKNLRFSTSVGDYFFAHAGVRPGVRLDWQDPEDLMWIRDEFLQSERWHGKYVIHGHTPTEAPDIKFNRMGIDTGAYITGNLTCLLIHEDEKFFL